MTRRTVAVPDKCDNARCRCLAIRRARFWYRLGAYSNFAVTVPAFIAYGLMATCFTTLTTLGYGDFTAANNPGRAIAIIEALTGQIYLITLVARLVAQFRAPGERNQ